MTRWFIYLLLGAFISVGLVGCSDEPSSSSSQPRNVAAKPPAKKVAKPAEAVKEEPKEPEFVYNAEGRRDPFVPLTLIKKPLVERPDEPETPLQSYDISQFRLTGLIVGKGDPKAMVIAPDGKSYVLAKGTKIGKNNGVVKDITSEAVLVEEKYYDFSGNVIENMQEIAVPNRERD